MIDKGTASVVRIFHSILNIPMPAKVPTCTLTIDPSVTNISVVIDEMMEEQAKVGCPAVGVEYTYAEFRVP